MAPDLDRLYHLAQDGDQHDRCAGQSFVRLSINIEAVCKLAGGPPWWCFGTTFHVSAR